MSEVRVPQDLWEEDLEGVLVAWLVDEGDSVDEGDVIAEIMVSKTQYEVPAPASGKIKQLVAPDDPVDKGSLIAELV